MAYKISTVQADAQVFEANQDKLLDYPRKPGAQIGGGVVVPIAQTWDGVGPPPYGWSAYKGSSVKHPSAEQWATLVDEQSAASLSNGKLTPQEQTKMSTDLSAAVPKLPSDWTPKVTESAQTPK